MAIHILSNIAWSKGNQTMKLGQLIEYNNRNIFLQNLCRKWCRENSSRPLLVFRKSLIWGKSRWSVPYFQYILIALNLTYNKCELYKTSDYWVKFRLNFNFSEKSLGLVVSRKIFLMLHFINWPNSIVWLPLLLEILDNMCITIVFNQAMTS